MDSSSTEEQTVEEEEAEAISPVEITVETEAEAGASGYSVTGGGQKGIFIKDVLKDSPAAKHLSLQQGDQLLSAKVYFDNVKYEDALKILQCAEPYKVSFLVKRTVPGGEIIVRPAASSLEVKGPKAKVPKMSVKSIKPFKLKKTRGGRFGLKRLKEKRGREELVIEGTLPRVDISDVDVEFCLPKMKHRSGIEATADETEGVVSGKRKKRIRFPKMRAIAHNAGATEVEIRGPLEGDVDASETKVKSKVKGPKFGITFPKTKSSTSDSSSAKGSMELKPPEVNLQPPSVEFCLSGNGSGGKLDVERRWAKFITPEVEFALPSGKAAGSLPNMPKSKVEIKAPEVDIKGDINVKGIGGKGKVPKIKRDAGVGKGDGKLRMPKIKLPKVRLSRHSDEIDGDFNIKAESAKMPDIEVAPPTVDVDFSLPTMKGNIGGDIKVPTANVKRGLDGVNAGMEVSMEKPSVKMPSVDIVLPKGKGKSVSHHVKGEIEMPGVSLDLGTGGKVPDEIEGPSFKGPNISMPTADISLPKTEFPEVEFQMKGRGIQIDCPSVDITPPSNLHGGDVEMDHYMGGDGKFKMPEFGISLPKMHPPKGEIKTEGQDTEVGFKLPKVGLNLPKGKLKGDDDCEGEGAAYKLPSFNVVLPKLKGGVDIEGQAKLEGPTMKGNIEMPDTDVSLPNRKGKKIKGKGAKLKKPKCDASLPMMNLPKGDLKLKGSDIQGNISLPEGKGDAQFEAHGGERGKFQMPSIDISLPEMKAKGLDVNIEGPEVEGGKFAMPSFNVSLPKVNLTEGYVELEGSDMKGKVEVPDVDLSLPKGKVEGDIDIDAHTGKGGKFHMPSIDLSLPKMKVKGPDVNIESPEVKGGKFAMPSLDVSLPKVNLPGGDVKLEGPEMKGKMEMPDVDLSLPKGKVEGDIDIDAHVGKGGKFHMPSIDLSLPKMKVKGPNVNIEGPEVKEGKFALPSLDVSLPKVNLPGGNVELEGPDMKGKVEMPDVNISLPKGKVEGEINVEGKGGKFKMPKFDVSLPKLNLPEGNVKLEGPEMKGKMEMPDVDLSLPKGKVEGDIDIDVHAGKGGKFHMPSIDFSLPRMKAKGPDVNIEGPEVKGGKFALPSFDVSLPKVNLPRGNIELEGPDMKGKVELPDVDISIPKGKAEGEINIEGKGRKFKMPKFDISLPKINLPEGNIKLDGPEIKGKMEMPDVDLSLPKGKVEGDIDINAHVGKGGKFHMPSIDLSLPKKVDISAPKVDLDFSLAKPKTDDVELALLKAEGGRPSSGSSFEMPDVSLKLPRFSLPKFGGKPKSRELEVEGHIPKGDITLSPPEGELTAPSVEFDDGNGNVKVKVNKPKIKMPSFGISKKTSDISVSCPEGDADATLEGEIHKGGFNAPNVTIKLPKFSGFGFKEGSMGKTSGDLHTKAKVKMPAVELSLPAAKTPDTEVLLPKVEVDVSEGDIRAYECKVKIPKVPTIGVSAPKTERDVGMPGVGRGGFKIPHVGLPDINISVPKGKSAKIKRQEIELKGSGELDVSDVEIDGLGQSKFNMPRVKIPNIDITLPKVKIGKAYTPDVDLKDTAVEGKALLADINSPGVEIEGKKGKLTMPQIKMPNVDITLPQVKSGKIERPDVEMEMKGTGGGHFKMPNVNILLPQGKIGKLEQPGVDLDTEGEEHNLKMPGIKVTSNLEGPDAKVSLPSMESKEDDEGLSFKTPHVKMPNVAISLPKGKTGEFEPSEKRLKGGKLKGPDVKLPSAHISIPEVTDSDLKLEGTKGKKKMELPDIELSTPEASVNAKGAKVKGTKFKIGMPKMKNSAEANVEIKKGGKGEMSGEMDVSGSSYGESDLLLPKEAGKAPSIPDIDFDISDSQEEDSKIGKGQKIKIPKFGVALPAISAPEVRLNVHQTDIHYETLPKVKKAMFVLVNPEAEEPVMPATVPGKEGSVNLETGDAQVRIPKIKMKPTFGKTDAKDKVSLQVEGSSSGLDGEKNLHIESKNDKTKTGGKIKLPKVVFSSPYTKMGGEEDTELSAKLVTDSYLEGTDAHVKGMTVKSSKTSFAGFSMTSGVGTKEIPGTEERGDVVKSPARTDMPDRDRSESPDPLFAGYSMGFTSSKFQEWDETQGADAAEASSWFKVPKFSLKPHSTGFLQITPEGSPRAQRRSEVSDEVGGEAGVSGMFSLHSSEMDFSSSQMSEQHHMSTVQEGSVTMVTKTTKTTRQLVTTETRTGEGSVTTTTRRVLDYEQ